MLKMPNFGGARAALAPGPFRTYTMGNVTSLVGTWMQRISVGYLTWEMTQSATWLGIIAFADLFPTVIIGPFAGVLADRWNRHRILQWVQVLGFVQALTLAVLHATGALSIGVLFTITLTLGVIQAFAQPARLSIVSSMVPRELLASAVAVNAISFNLARFLGPAASGILISTAGVSWAFAANAASYLAFMVALHHLPRAIGAAPDRLPSSFRRQMAEGLGYIIRDRATALVMATMMVAGIGSRPLIELLPGFSGQVFDMGASGLAALTSAIGVGAILGGARIASLPAGQPMTGRMIGSAVAAAAGVVVFTLTDNILVAVPILCAVGFFWVSTAICAQTLLQLGVADGLRGRVLSIYGLIGKASPAVGALGIGMLADSFGLRVSVAAAASVVALYMLTLALYARVIAEGLEPDAPR